mmetsp:Transcript_68364/g.198135  ORF Transcript_68364/g.198135 Transcript_68364/m.198135 type:complete len:206 (+) Transcript_68364:954-1571(+)
MLSTPPFSQTTPSPSALPNTQAHVSQSPAQAMDCSIKYHGNVPPGLKPYTAATSPRTFSDPVSSPVSASGPHRSKIAPTPGSRSRTHPPSPASFRKTEPFLPGSSATTATLSPGNIGQAPATKGASEAGSRRGHAISLQAQAAAKVSVEASDGASALDAPPPLSSAVDGAGILRSSVAQLIADVGEGNMSPHSAASRVVMNSSCG